MQRLSLPIHGALELVLGLALLGLPFALGLGPAGIVLGVAAGALVAGLGLAGTDALSLRTHLALDQAAVAALLLATLALAALTDAAGALLFGAAAAAEVALLNATRWSR